MMQTMHLMSGYMNDQLKNEMEMDERVSQKQITFEQAEAETDEWAEVRSRRSY